MSSLCFIQAPPCPDDIDEEVWNNEWIGLSVALSSEFPSTIGYLGEGSARIWDATTSLYRHPTDLDSMNFFTFKLSELAWVSRDSLILGCRNSIPVRQTILNWLESDNQKLREMFSIPKHMGEYIPG